MLLSGHLQTIVPAFWRRVLCPEPELERVEMADGDFLDLDWYRRGSDRLAVLSHGLEGCSRAGYMRGMAAALFGAGWDVLAWNFRSCSGRMNRLPRFYHSGDTADLAFLIRRAAPAYASLSLVGFSLGGNIMLKYLGERPSDVPAVVKGAVAFSVPCDLASSAGRLDQPANRLYTRRFLRSLQRKVREKAAALPGAIDPAGVGRIRTFREFDDRYTAPMHGFLDADDYWRQSSSRQFLQNIRVPTLLINARNDPFLAPECFPWEEARESEAFHFEAPLSGGHVGFPSFGGVLWSEARTLAFLEPLTR